MASHCASGPSWQEKKVQPGQGGLLAALVVIYGCGRLLALPWPAYLDVLAVGFPLGHANGLRRLLSWYSPPPSSRCPSCGRHAMGGYTNAFRWAKIPQLETSAKVRDKCSRRCEIL